MYILFSPSHDRYYIGSTVDLEHRVARHNAGTNASTKAYRPWQLVYSENFETLGLARRRESEVKSWKSRTHMVEKLGIVH